LRNTKAEFLGITQARPSHLSPCTQRIFFRFHENAQDFRFQIRGHDLFRLSCQQIAGRHQQKLILAGIMAAIERVKSQALH
jgi:hypothetical protein